uniref:Apple domain-containing protein n=1 Tax=Romanomermis culicivorax TaxID=13658 RepID=A0A915KPN6_ROMCU
DLQYVTRVASGQPPKDTEEDPVFCTIQVHSGFHVYNPVARLRTGNRFDCILACSHHELCETSNFVKKSNLCFLHGSKPKSGIKVIREDLVPSVLSVLQCGGEDGLKNF